jgi:hypothetical protein
MRQPPGLTFIEYNTPPVVREYGSIIVHVTAILSLNGLVGSKHYV